MPTIEIDHFFTHAGATFSCTGETTALTLDTVYYLVRTNGHPVHLIHYNFVSTQANALIELFENPTTTDDGSEMTVNNKNRMSSNISTTQVFLNPVVTDDGTELEHDMITGGKHSGGATFDEGGYEWVLAPNTDHLLKYTNRANQDDDFTHKFVFLEPAQA